MESIKFYKRISKNLAQLISLAKMYKYEHPMVTKKAEDTYKELKDFLSESKQSLVFAKSADMLLINGEKIEPESNLMKKFIDDFINLDIGSLEIEPNAGKEDLDAFIHLICHAEQSRGVDKIKQFFLNKKAAHVTARAATFKLVQENEDIVKKGGFVKVEDIPPEVLLKFSQDLKEGNVAQGLKSGDKDYKTAAHNSTFLASMAFNLLKDKDSPEGLEKILWLMADYLIDEIGSFKEEDMNREVLEDVKKKLLEKWQDKPEKKPMAEHVERTYKVINTALQLKGLMAIYKKHKKSIETTVKRIKNIVKNLPQDSQLYQKITKTLAETGDDKFF
jgi:hypothetical protein